MRAAIALHLEGLAEDGEPDELFAFAVAEGLVRQNAFEYDTAVRCRRSHLILIEGGPPSNYSAWSP